MESLTPKQLKILEWIEQHLNAHHTMPSRREIAAGLGLSSPATIQQHIEALEKKGFLKRGETQESRALQWTAKSKKFLSLVAGQNARANAQGQNTSSNSQSEGDIPTSTNSSSLLPFVRPHSYEIPLLGTIAAGYPIEVYPESRPMSVPLDLFLSPKQAELSKDDVYMLSVRGDSMIDEGIFPNDWVILKKSGTAKNGDTVAALLNGEATLKKYMRTKSGAELHPANPKYPVIPVTMEDRFEIQGIMIGLIRRP
jgi:repressor LexA